MSQEYKAFTPTVIFIGMRLGVERFGVEHLGFERLLFPILSPHLQDSYLTAVLPILGHYLK